MPQITFRAKEEKEKVKKFVLRDEDLPMYEDELDPEDFGYQQIKDENLS